MARVEYLIEFRLNLASRLPSLAALNESLACFGVPARDRIALNAPLVASLTVERMFTPEEEAVVKGIVEKHLTEALQEYDPVLVSFRYNGPVAAAA